MSLHWRDLISNVVLNTSKEKIYYTKAVKFFGVNSMLLLLRKTNDFLVSCLIEIQGGAGKRENLKLIDVYKRQTYGSAREEVNQIGLRTIKC